MFKKLPTSGREVSKIRKTNADVVYGWSLKCMKTIVFLQKKWLSNEKLRDAVTQLDSNTKNTSKLIQPICQIGQNIWCPQSVSHSNHYCDRKSVAIIFEQISGSLHRAQSKYFEINRFSKLSQQLKISEKNKLIAKICSDYL